jgi:hypothetical protein
MRKSGFLLMMALAAGLGALSVSAPAKAYDYPWCLQGRGPGYPGDCSYQTYAQCKAAASGRAVYCGVNPMTAFAQDRRGRTVYPDRYPYRGW